MDDHIQTAKAIAASLGPKVWEAYLLAEEEHKDQKRKSGEPYVMHPVAVAKLLFDIGSDPDTIIAGFLHDTLEDSDDPDHLRERIERSFGDHVLYMIEALSKDQTITDKIEQQDAYMEQIKDAFSVDISVFFIKVADLLHNMSTIVSLSPERKERWIHELKYLYLPLLSEYYHNVPLHYQERYEKLMIEVQNVIESYQEG